MSFNNTEGFNNTSSGGGREGFSDSRGGVESYGQGTGAGAYDPANTGLGGYGSQNQQRGSNDQSTQSSNNFDDPTSQNQNQGSGQGAFGRDRGSEKPGFGGSDSNYGNTSTGATFGSQRSNSGLNQSSGVGQRDDLDDDNSSSIPGTRASGGASGGAYGNTNTDTSSGNQDQFSDSQQSQQGQQGQQGGARSDQYGGESQREREGGKPTFGDKMRGTAEKLAGTVSGKQDLKSRGEERKTGGDY